MSNALLFLTDNEERQWVRTVERVLVLATLELWL